MLARSSSSTQNEESNLGRLDSMDILTNVNRYLCARLCLAHEQARERSVLLVH